ncbi:MAG: hypothetical protein WC043_07420 [Pseudobdellovibrionaceae bacterium]
MDKVIYYGAFVCNILLILVTGFILTESYGREMFLAALLAVPPVISILALLHGPDREERRLAKELRKAKLKQELAALTPAKP